MKEPVPDWGIGAAAAYLASSCAICWAISGWETSAITLGWAIALDPVLEENPRAIDAWRSLIVAGLTVLFRPDAGLLLAALALYWASTAKSNERLSVIAAVMVAAVPALALGVFQRGYYGSWIPNTATLKRSAGILSVGPGIEYVLMSIFRYPFNAAVVAGGYIRSAPAAKARGSAARRAGGHLSALRGCSRRRSFRARSIPSSNTADSDGSRRRRIYRESGSGRMRGENF